MKTVANQAQRRGRGRPKIDDTRLLNDVLITWLRIGGSGRRGLGPAVRAVISHERTDVKWARQRVHQAFREMTDETMLERATAVAEDRGEVVPNWASDQLQEISAQRREWEADPEVRTRVASLQADLAAREAEGWRSTRPLPTPPLAEVDRDRIRRIHAFLDAFDLSTDMKISKANRLYGLTHAHVWSLLGD